MTNVIGNKVKLVYTFILTETVTGETRFKVDFSNNNPADLGYIEFNKVFTSEPNFHLEMLINFTYDDQNKLFISIGEGLEFHVDTLVYFVRYLSENVPQTIRVQSSSPSMWMRVWFNQFFDDDNSELLISVAVKKVNDSANGNGQCFSKSNFVQVSIHVVWVQISSKLSKTHVH